MTPRDVRELVHKSLQQIADGAEVTFATSPFEEVKRNGRLRHHVRHDFSRGAGATAEFGQVIQPVTIRVECLAQRNNPQLADTLAQKVFNELRPLLNAGGVTLPQCLYSDEYPERQTTADIQLNVILVGSYVLS